MTSTAAAEVVPSLPTARRRHRRRWARVALVVAAGASAAWRVPALVVRPRRPTSGPGRRSVTADGMAARYGIDVSLIAVTRGRRAGRVPLPGGRPRQGRPGVCTIPACPAVVVEDTGETLVISLPAAHHGRELQLGGTYFFLLANAHNAIHRGSQRDPGDRRRPARARRGAGMSRSGIRRRRAAAWGAAAVLAGTLLAPAPTQAQDALMHDVVVTLRVQADLDGVSRAGGQRATHRRLLEHLRASAGEAQRPVQRVLSGLRAAGQVDRVTSYWISNSLSMAASAPPSPRSGPSRRCSA